MQKIYIWLEKINISCPSDLYRGYYDNKKQSHKCQYFRKICAKYELDKDNKLIYIGNNPKKN